MVSLTEQKQFRELQHLPFCYLCGIEFQLNDETDKDHVISKKIFLEGDRTPPLKLKTHKLCNNKMSGFDECIGQLINLMHNVRPSKDKLKLRLIQHADETIDDKRATFSLPINHLIFRWVRGCHAALYREYLPDPKKNKNRAILSPFNMGQQSEEGIISFDMNIKEQFVMAAHALQKSMLTKSVDRIECYRGKFKYYCTWPVLDNGDPFCIFALDIYNWRKLGLVKGGLSRDCIGAYFHAQKPPNASTSTLLDIPLKMKNPLVIFDS